MTHRPVPSPEPFDSTRSASAHRGLPGAVSVLRVPLRVVSGLGALVLLGAFLLLLPPMGGQRQLLLNEAFFTAVSALTVTGLTVITPFTDLSLPGKLVLLGLIQVGGVGYMTLATLAFRLLGREVSFVDRLALREAIGLREAGSVVQLVRHILLAVLLLEGAGALLLYWHWRETLPGGDRLLYAIFHAVSAFCNAGFDLFHGHPEFPRGVPNDTGTLAIMGTLIFLGTLGVPVLFDLLTFSWRKRLSLHTRITLPVILFLSFGGALGLLISESFTGGVLSDKPFHRQIALALYQSVSGRTAGFVCIPELGTLHPSSDFLLNCLMFVGSAPASMGGGITTGTLVTLVLAIWAYGRGWSTPVIGGRAVPGEMIRKAAAVFALSVFVVVTATWLLLVTHHTALQPTLFEVVSAFATCGLSLGMTRDLNLFGQILIMAMMFWGRLGALTVVIVLTRRRPPRLVTYPEERILIG